MQNPTFGGALVTDNGGIRSSKNKFLSRNGCVNILEALEDSVDDSEMCEILYKLYKGLSDAD